MKDKVLAELKKIFRPEFLNRIDAMVVFHSLTGEEIRQIVDLMLARVREQLRAQQMTLEVTQEAKDHIVKMGYDPAYGARPLRRVIQNMVEDVLAEHLLLGKYEPGTTIVVDGTPKPASISTPPSPGRRSRLGDPAPRPRAGVGRRGTAPEPLVCQSCGEAFLRWEGQCRACGGWNSLVETVVREPTAGGTGPCCARVVAGTGVLNRPR